MKAKSSFYTIFVCFAWFFFGGLTTLHAQFNACQDTLNTNPVYCYDTTYNPVCGCNNVTYINLCFFNQAHLLRYTPSTCEEITVQHIFPNPTSDYINFRIYVRDTADVPLYIYDTDGQVRYYSFLAGIHDYSNELEVRTLPTGVYILVAIAEGHFAYKKFVKY